MSSPWTAGQTARARNEAPIPTQRIRGDDTSYQLALRKAALLERLRNEQPDLRDLALASVADPPHDSDGQPVRGWLAPLTAEGVMVLEHRAGSVGIIDYLAIAASGVHVVQARSFRGQHVELRRTGGFLAPRTEHLVIGGVDRTHLISDLWPVLEEVYEALDLQAGLEQVYARPVLGLVETSLPIFSVLEVGGVPILGARRLGQLLRRPGPLSAWDCARVLRVLAAAFPPASEGVELGEDPLDAPAAG